MVQFFIFLQMSNFNISYFNVEELLLLFISFKYTSINFFKSYFQNEIIKKQNLKNKSTYFKYLWFVMSPSS